MTDQLDKLRPALVLLAVLVVAAILGFMWGASSTAVVDTGLWQLETGYQGMYLQSVADAYALDGNDDLALNRLSFLCQSEGDIEAASAWAAEQYGASPSKLANLDQLMTLANSVDVVENPAANVCNNKPVGTMAALGRTVAPLLLVLGALGVIGYGLWTAGMLDSVLNREPKAETGDATEKKEEVQAAGAAPAGTAPTRAAPVTRPGLATPPPAKPTPTGEETAPAQSSVSAPPEEAETKRRSPLSAIPGFGLGRRREEPEEPKSAAATGAKLSQEAEKTDFEAMGQEPPLVQFMTTYLHGDDLYDDSFSIESSSGEFLGETGVGISETLSSPGEAKEVTALEVWLFDKNDIRTVTKVLMSDFAFNDDSIRAQLAPKGEAVLAEANKKVVLQTATLRVQARIVDLAYKQDTMPMQSVIERITVELAAWRRSAQGESRPGGLPGSSSGSDFSYPSRGNLPG